MTIEEFIQLPETMLPRHLVEGVVIDMPAPNLAHQLVILRLANWLFNRLSHIQGSVFVAPVDVYLNEFNIVQPDVLWVAQERLSILQTKHIRGAPDFVAEVLSPSTAKFDRSAKFRLYERHGVRELWLVDPTARLVEVWVLREGEFAYIDAYTVGETFTSTLFGAVEVGALFPDAAPTDAE
jgi:Uma2 family endonuclease